MLIFTAFVLFQSVLSITAAKISWCDYFNKLGVYKPECAKKSPAWPTDETTFQHQIKTFNVQKPNVIQGQNTFHNQMKTYSLQSPNVVQVGNTFRPYSSPKPNIIQAQNALQNQMKPYSLQNSNIVQVGNTFRSYNLQKLNTIQGQSTFQNQMNTYKPQNQNALQKYSLNFQEPRSINPGYISNQRQIAQFYSTAVTKRPIMTLKPPYPSIRTKVNGGRRILEVTRTTYRTIGTTPKPSVYGGIAVATTTQISLRSVLKDCKNGIHMTSCRRSDRCASGETCLQDGQACCVSVPKEAKEPECPHPKLLTHSCNRGKGIQWCESDYDCKPRSSQKCCPTLCSYNVCVNVRRPKTIANVALIPKTPTQCPDPEAVQVHCVRTRKYVSWCQEDAHCNGRNKFQKRICCPTRCDYNVCLLNWLGKWIIA